LKSGEAVELFNGEGKGYAGKVEFKGGKVLVCELQDIAPEQPSCRLLLAPALIRSVKFEWTLQKATELGVMEIFPLKTSLGDIEIPENRMAARLERWRKIVREASKQSRRLSAPRVHEPMKFSDLLCLKDLRDSTKFLFYEKAPKPLQFESNLVSDQILVCVGPEGGWIDNEVEKAGRAGFQVFSLGPWILRAETASVAALSIIQFQIANFRSQNSKSY